VVPTAKATGAGQTVWRSAERLSATGAVVLAVALAISRSPWPFAAPASGADASLWNFLLSDRVTLGFVRLSLVLLSLFVIASVPALFAAGRWLKGFGSGGVTADEARDATAVARQVDELQEVLSEVKR